MKEEKIGCRRLFKFFLVSLLAFLVIDWLIEHHSITRMQQSAVNEFKFTCKQCGIREDAFLGPELDLSLGDRVFFRFKSKNYAVDSVWIGVGLRTSSWLYPYLSPPEVYDPDVGVAIERYRSGDLTWPIDSSRGK